MKVTRTITIDGKTEAEHQAIKAHLEALQTQHPGWTITHNPLTKRSTAFRSDDVTSL